MMQGYVKIYRNSHFRPNLSLYFKSCAKKLVTSFPVKHILKSFDFSISIVLNMPTFQINVKCWGVNQILLDFRYSHLAFVLYAKHINDRFYASSMNWGYRKNIVKSCLSKIKPINVYTLHTPKYKKMFFLCFWINYFNIWNIL